MGGDIVGGDIVGGGTGAERLGVDATVNQDASPGTNPAVHADASPVVDTSEHPLALGSSGKKRERERPVWADADKKALYDAYAVHGRDWQKLHEAVGPSKTLTQVKNFYQNYRHNFLTPMVASETGKKPKKS